MYGKNVYLSDEEEKAADIIIEAGYADNFSAAVRIAIRQFAAAIQFRPPLVTPTTPAL